MLAKQRHRELSKKRTKKRKSFSVTLKRKRTDVLKLAKEIPRETYTKVRESFAWAFFAKGLTYTTEHVYDHPEVPSTMNNAPLREPKV